MNPLKQLHQHHAFKWLNVIVITVLMIFLYVFMEWVFLITKPSFMSSIGLIEQLSIFFSVASLLITLYLILIDGMWLLSKLKINFLRNALIGLSLLIPGFIVAFLILLLIDNFTYTVFRFGIVTASGVFRALYALLFLVLTAISVNEVRKFIQPVDRLMHKIKQPLRNGFLFVLLVVFVAAGLLPVLTHTSAANTPAAVISASSRPHIFFITADGVNAENMSVYGYERETTPFINEMAQSSLVAMNAFTNSANTSGSIVSMFTSKSPIETRVLYPPDILKGEDVYQHLPAILTLNGYYTAQYSFEYYVDAYKLNFQNGFKEANGRTNESNTLSTINRVLPTNIGYFVYELSNRLLDRLRHIFFIKKMSNPFLKVLSPNEYQDEDKFDALIKVIEKTNQPIFAHLHWMGTHGPRYYPPQQVFSAGKDAERGVQSEYDVDFYDDSILAFDQAMAVFYNELENRGMLENSILIIGSDHGQGFKTYKRLPLIVRFPNGEYQSKLYPNVQNMDIAPTILDYLDLAQPQWMTGRSLLEELPQDRPIFSVGVGNVEVENGAVVPQTIQPPFYQFGFGGVIRCDHFYRINFADYSWEEEQIAEYAGDCAVEDNIPAAALELLIEFFAQHGYDTATMESASPGLEFTPADEARLLTPAARVRPVTAGCSMISTTGSIKPCFCP